MHGTAESNMTMESARVLLGWMETEQALRVQHGMRGDVDVSPASVERVRVARERVAARECGVDQRDLLAPPPRELASHVAELRRHPAMEKVFACGWAPSMVDLRRLCAVQSRVFTEQADERVRGIDAGDLHSIAAVSLPLPASAEFPARFDPARGAWILSSPDPNLKLTGNFNQQLGGETAGFGFAVSQSRSCVAAMEHRGRHYLTDGYHRAVAFLRRGITHIPALTRAVRDDEPFMAPAGMLPSSAYRGERPPRLADFLDEDVSLSVLLPVFRKIIIIQAIEVMA